MRVHTVTMINNDDYDIQDAMQVSSGKHHSLILTEDKSVYACGLTNWKRLRHGPIDHKEATWEPRLIKEFKNNAKQVVAGEYHSLVLTDAGKVFGFGGTQRGLLGLGREVTAYTPTEVPGIENAIQIASSNWHTLILTKDKKVYFSGDENYSGRKPADKSRKECKGPLRMGGVDRTFCYAFKPIPGIENAIAVAAGGEHSLILTADKRVYSFGVNDKGQLGLGAKFKGPAARKGAESHLVGVPTLIRRIPRIVQIAAGGAHSVLLTEDGNVLVFGDNSKGQLGLGKSLEGKALSELTSVRQPMLIRHIPRITKIAAGNKHTLLVTEDNAVWGFGDNSRGQLGGDRRGAKSVGSPKEVWRKPR